MKKLKSLILVFSIILVSILSIPIEAKADGPDYSVFSGEWETYKLYYNGNFHSIGEEFTCDICHQTHTITKDLFQLSITGTTAVLTSSCDCGGTYTLGVYPSGSNPEDVGKFYLTDWPFVGASGKHKGRIEPNDAAPPTFEYRYLNLYAQWSSYHFYLVPKQNGTCSGSYIDPLLNDFDNLLNSSNEEDATEEKTIEWDKGDSLPLSVMEKLQTLSNVSLLFSFEYEGEKHRVLIPAGESITDPDILWYGPLWLLGKYGEYDPDGRKYTVKPGDNMKAIAKELGLSLETLLKKNSQISDPTKIYPGQEIYY